MAVRQPDQGDLGTVIVTAAVTAVCVFLLSRDVWKLTALRLGEERAVGLGINLQLLRLKTLVLVAVMTATAISFVGVIGFIGLVAPHVARILLGEDQRFFLPGAMLAGGGVFIGSQRVVQGDYPGCAVSGGDCYVVCRRAVLLLDCVNETVGRLKC